MVVSAVAFAERQPYSRYESIVDRQMFGQPPDGFDPTRPASEVSAKDERAKEKELTKEQEQLKSAIHFSMVNVTPSGETAVGFTDNSDSKNPVHYYLKVGESRNGWTVKAADPAAASMTITKGEIEVSLDLGGNSANGGTKRASSDGSDGESHRKGLLGSRSRMELGSLRGRRKLREQQAAEEREAAAEARKVAMAEREAAKAEREAEKAEREAEREQQRQQLLQIQEELKKAREEAEAKKADEENKQEESTQE